MLALCGVPLVLVRVRPVDQRDNQAATYIMIDPVSGFAPPEWQDSIGEVIAFRADRKPFTSAHFYAVWDFFCVVLDAYGDGSPAAVRRRYFSPTKFRAILEERAPRAGLVW